MKLTTKWRLALAGWLAGAAALCAVHPPPVVAGEPVDVQVANVGDRGFTVAWLTAVAEAGWVDYGRCGTAATRANDVRGANFTGLTHFVNITGLDRGAEYCFRTVSGSKIESPEHRQRTFSALGSPPVPVGFGGTIRYPNGLPAANALVYIRLQITSTGAQSEPIAVLSATNGTWASSLARATDANGQPMSISSSGDRANITAQAAVDANGQITVDTSVVTSLQGNIQLTGGQATATPVPPSVTPTLSPTNTPASAESSPTPSATPMVAPAVAFSPSPTSVIANPAPTAEGQVPAATASDPPQYGTPSTALASATAAPLLAAATAPVAQPALVAPTPGSGTPPVAVPPGTLPAGAAQPASTPLVTGQPRVPPPMGSAVFPPAPAAIATARPGVTTPPVTPIAPSLTPTRTATPTPSPDEGNTRIVLGLVILAMLGIMGIVAVIGLGAVRKLRQ